MKLRSLLGVFRIKAQIRALQSENNQLWDSLHLQADRIQELERRLNQSIDMQNVNADWMVDQFARLDTATGKDHELSESNRRTLAFITHLLETKLGIHIVVNNVARSVKPEPPSNVIRLPLRRVTKGDPPKGGA
ncbi:MAG: hypothetical protein GEV05_24315 [Betaproteobacteria bacterium]|nr:hypothetical protein [Betaproteobacteria bacterium]